MERVSGMLLKTWIFLELGLIPRSEIWILPVLDFDNVRGHPLEFS